MQINRISKDGIIEELKGFDMHLEIFGEDEEYLIAMVIGDEDNGIVLTLDAQDYKELRHALMLANNEIIKNIRADRKEKRKVQELERAAEKEFDC